MTPAPSPTVRSSLRYAETRVRYAIRVNSSSPSPKSAEYALMRRLANPRARVTPKIGIGLAILRDAYDLGSPQDRNCITKQCFGSTEWFREHSDAISRQLGHIRPEAVGGTINGFDVDFYRQLSNACIRVMDEYQPAISTERWERIRTFVEDAVTVAAPLCAYSTRRLLSVTSQFADWAHNSRGYQLDARLLFRREMVELWINDPKLAYAEGTRRNYRSMLLRIAEVVLPASNPIPLTPLNARTGAVPYSSDELELLMRWAKNQPTPNLKRNALVLLSLSAGAGLWAREVGDVKRRDIVIDEEGILIFVAGSKARSVPLLSSYEKPLKWAVRELADDDNVFGERNRMNYDNLISSFVQRSSRSRGIPQPQTHRMRASWLVTQLAARTDMRALMFAAGIDKFENLSRLLAHVPELDTAEYRRQLRAEAHA